ncbi:MAG TPA: hypothetical protein VNI55_09340 [Gaiellaceae bacterium]|nr:hypothetical protein [Gaiellaceae bacterium]
MDPQFRKVALIAAVLGLAVAVVLALRSNDDGSTTATAATPAPIEPTTIAIVVAAGRPTGGVQRVSVSQGERAVLVVTSDIAGEVHVHGYDLSAELEAGGSAELPFTATIVGRFEVELEERGVQLAEIDVRP